MERPVLSTELDGATFRSFYYLKEELVRFCREHQLPAGGGKQVLTERIAHYLDTGEVPAAAVTGRKRARGSGVFREDSVIETDFVCSERHRAFFREKIVPGFTFNVPFQRWLKSNPGKTYGEAIDAYRQIIEEKKRGKTVIDPQFEYNAYIRDFFAAQPGRSLDDAIQCWKYKKSLPGQHRYEAADLAVLSGDGE